MDEIWGQACAALETSVGPNNFNHWIKPLRLTGVDEGIAHFASPTRFISDWVNRHFAKDILGELSRHGAPVERLRFEVVPQTAPGGAVLKKPKKPKVKVIPGAGKGKIHMGNWFEADDDKPKAKAVRAVPKFGEKPRPKKK